MLMRRQLLVAMLLTLSGIVGCAYFAKRPDSPALKLGPADMDPEDPNVRCYVLIFGSESRPKRPKFTHTWASIVRVEQSVANAEPRIDIQTISWMPATLDIRPWSLWVETGVNLELHETIREMLSHDEIITMWGPYEVWHGMYKGFSVQKAFLESGAIGYQCIDTIGEASHGKGSDCIHAITDMDRVFAREHYPLRYFGISGSKHIVKQIMERPLIINPPQTHDWLLAKLGLCQYPIKRASYHGKMVPYSPEAREEFLRKYAHKIKKNGANIPIP